MNAAIFHAEILPTCMDSRYLVCRGFFFFFFHRLEFWVPLVCRTPIVLCQSFWKFPRVFFTIFWTCACRFDIIFRLIFLHFFRILNLVIFLAPILPTRTDKGYFVCAALLWIYADLKKKKKKKKIWQVFCHILKICMWLGYNSNINFCHLFRILNSSCLIVGTCRGPQCSMETKF